jgi:hypothetical protein
MRRVRFKWGRRRKERVTPFGTIKAQLGLLTSLPSLPLSYVAADISIIIVVFVIVIVE